ncbi:MAG: AAA family ATPase [Patescibacteria group bacterium]|nr:AAA family ATPase [Patescibacteria group bacterium]MDE2106525.1 AAA family ATPase [Patescibacteria group bacterium]
MKTKKMKAILAAGIPVLFTGAPGVGKTEKIRACFDHVEILLLSGESEENIGGLPYRDGAHDYRTIPAMFRRLSDAAAAGKSTALFLDEIDKAERSVADTLLTLVASRQINGNRLPADCAIIGAANPPEWGGGDGLSVPMLNRFAVVEFAPSPPEWGAWAMERHRSPRCAKIIQLVLSGTIPLLETVGDGMETRTTSPRSLARVMRAVEAVDDADALELIVRGLLTPNAAGKIIAAIAVEDADVEILEAAKDHAKQVAVRKNRKTVKPIEV